VVESNTTRAIGPTGALIWKGMNLIRRHLDIEDDPGGAAHQRFRSFAQVAEVVEPTCP
jgi:hypothetical protein